FFGRTGGWEKVQHSGDADATFIGQGSDCTLGAGVLISSDMNADGICDVLISAPLAPNNDPNAPNYHHGTISLFFGRESGWEKNMTMDQADASFIGENANDNFGSIITRIGDVTGEGDDCILIASPNNDDAQSESGKIYMIKGSIVETTPPVEIFSLGAFENEEMSFPLSIPDIQDRIFIKLTGRDGNSSTRDFAVINITYSGFAVHSSRTTLRETGFETGVYVGSITVPACCQYGDTLKISSRDDPSFEIGYTVDTPVRLNEIPSLIKVQQYEDLKIEVRNLGYRQDPTWIFDTDAEWLSFDIETGSVTGKGMNIDVGNYRATIKVVDFSGKSDEAEMDIKLFNTAPIIITENVEYISEDQHYYVDYDSNEDGDGDIRWYLNTDASWLSMMEETGELLGNPTNSEIGGYYVKVILRDGNGGECVQMFDLEVTDINDPPTIVSIDHDKAVQGELYRVDYDLEDIDPVDDHEWSIETSAKWLAIDNRTGVLKGTPENDDVGTHDIVVRVTDKRGLSDEHRFKIEVENVNDPPFFTNIPKSLEVFTGQYLSIDLDARDPDAGSALTYSVSSQPFCNMMIDQQTGEITWKGSIDWFTSTPYRIEVTAGVSDGEFVIREKFTVTVKLTEPPVTTLLYPPDEKKIGMIDPVLHWDGYDEDGDTITYDVYLSDNKAFVVVQKEETLLCREYSGDSIDVSGLEPGKLYYWTVVPFDGGLHGTCQSGVFSFKMNCPPQVEDVKFIDAKVGEELKYRFACSDNDPEDVNALNFKCVLGPSGLTVGEATGVLRWIPGKDQAGEHMVVVNVTDGLDTVTMKFTIDVESSESGIGGNAVVAGSMIGGSVMVSVSLIALVVVIIRRKGKGKDIHETEVTEETIIGEVEVEGVKKVRCDVAITPTEAHANLGRGSKPVTYEELYGKREHKEEEEGLTTRELKEFIHSQIDELEHIEE
ncbi:MAG: putative Ig domain-containing protein, partial [Thermoplasmatota archaeon]